MSAKLKRLLPPPKYTIDQLIEIFDRRPGARAEVERRGKVGKGSVTRMLKRQSTSDRLHRIACKLADELLAEEQRMFMREAATSEAVA